MDRASAQSIGKQSGESVKSVRKKKKGYGGKDWQKKKALCLERKSEGVIGDENGESMEPREAMPLIGLGERWLERLVRG